jgi:plastocyanin
LRHRCKRAALAVGVTTFALAAPISAQAAAKQVFMGTPPSEQKTFNEKYGIDVNDFFPHTISVHVGDSVRFVPRGFHTADFPTKGGDDLPVFVPTGQNIANALDTGNNPFWFNGQPQIGFNPQVANPSTALFGKRATYNGGARVATGLPLGQNPKPATIRFTKTGTFTYLCDVHPGMKGTVRVLPKSKRVPSVRSDAKVVKQMTARDLAVGKQLRKTKVPAGAVDVGEAGRFGVEYFNFLPNNLTVPVGTTVNFQMTKRSREVHTATTGPGDPVTDPNSYLGRLVASLQAPVPDPAALYPSDQPGTPASLTPQLHGNGFWNSGVIDNEDSTPAPFSNSVRFDAPGTYQFYCLIHPFMHGTIMVTG